MRLLIERTLATKADVGVQPLTVDMASNGVVSSLVRNQLLLEGI